MPQVHLRCRARCWVATRPIGGKVEHLLCLHVDRSSIVQAASALVAHRWLVHPDLVRTGALLLAKTPFTALFARIATRRLPRRTHPRTADSISSTSSYPTGPPTPQPGQSTWRSPDPARPERRHAQRASPIAALHSEHREPTNRSREQANGGRRNLTDTKSIPTIHAILNQARQRPEQLR